jgi:hypothetical protein
MNKWFQKRSVWLAIFFFVAAGMAANSPRNFRAHLSGSEQPVPVQTQAQGQAIFQLSADETALHYQLNVANIENVFMAHIHYGPPGENGPVVAWLYPASPPSVLIPDRFSGVLAAGVIQDTNLMGPLMGQTIQDLVDLIQDGEAYVNVHTSQVPSGEIRGQIR